jgi:hypothetical protein
MPDHDKLRQEPEKAAWFFAPYSAVKLKRKMPRDKMRLVDGRQVSGSLIWRHEARNPSSSNKR